jgi:hypothetical protein
MKLGYGHSGTRPGAPLRSSSNFVFVIRCENEISSVWRTGRTTLITAPLEPLLQRREGFEGQTWTD